MLSHLVCYLDVFAFKQRKPFFPKRKQHISEKRDKWFLLEKKDLRISGSPQALISCFHEFFNAISASSDPVALRTAQYFVRVVSGPGGMSWCRQLLQAWRSVGRNRVEHRVQVLICSCCGFSQTCSICASSMKTAHIPSWQFRSGRGQVGITLESPSTP